MIGRSSQAPGRLAVALAAVLLLWTCRSNGTSEPEDPRTPDMNAQPEPLPMDSVDRGAIGAIVERGVRVARTREELEAMWDEQTALVSPRPALPDVDFERSMVVAAFSGQRTSGGYSIAIEEIVAVPASDASPARIVVRVAETAPSPDDAVTMAMTAPYDIVVVPRADGGAELEVL